MSPCRAAAVIRCNQDAASSLWYRLCSTFGVSRFSKRLFSSTSLASGTNESPAPENPNGRGGGGWGWKGTDSVQSKADEDEQKFINPGSPSPRAASTRDKRPRRKRPSLSSTEGENNASTINQEMSGGAAQRLFGRVAAIHWVDGGNGGLAGGSFPTNMCSLARLAALPNLVIRVHGSPYQWSNNCRPFLAFEADAFLDSVEGFRQASSMRDRDGFEEFGPSTAAEGSSIDGGNGSGSSGRDYLRDAASRVARDTDSQASISSEAGSEGGGGAGGAKEIGRIGTGRGTGAACDVKRVVYFESEQPTLDIHFRVLRELNTE